jgi:hypothetical protein
MIREQGRQKGDGLRFIPRNERNSPQFANLCGEPQRPQKRMFSRDFALLGRSHVLSENRGVPGSSPGLAINKGPGNHGPQTSRLGTNALRRLSGSGLTSEPQGSSPILASPISPDTIRYRDRE